nr:hypothetical protein [Vibrio alginolyticus]
MKLTMIINIGIVGQMIVVGGMSLKPYKKGMVCLLVKRFDMSLTK